MPDDAEAIARVVSDIRKGVVKSALTRDSVNAKTLYEMAVAFSGLGPVVDATPIYHALVDKAEPVDMYGDHVIAPPWDFGSICYRNEHGNVIVMSNQAVDWHDTDDNMPMDKESWRKVADSMERLVGGTSNDRWDTDEPINWDDVRWTIDTFVWVGGRSGDGRSFGTRGPVHLWRSAVYGDGTPADLHWVQLVHDYPMKHWDMAHLVLLGAFTFCNTTNCEIAEPARPRAEQKRVDRTGIRVSQIHVRPMGKTTRGEKRLEPLDLTARHGVRGHMAHYGDCCPGRHDPKGKLFGKLQGRYWIPPHVRGNPEHGEIVQGYTLEP